MMKRPSAPIFGVDPLFVINKILVPATGIEPVTP